MTDQRRTVSIDLQAIDNTSKKVDAIVKSFAGLDKAVISISSSVGTLFEKLAGIQIPALDGVASALKSLNGVKLPDMGKFADGMAKLASIGKIPDLSQAAEELKKIAGIKVPGIQQLAAGLEKLSGATIDVSASASAIKGIIGPLERLARINIPNVSNLANGISNLSGIVISPGTISSITGFVNALIALDGVKVPGMTKIAAGLTQISKIPDINVVANNLQVFSNALQAFKDVKIPAVYQLALGFKQLGSMDVAKITQNIIDLSKAITVLEQSGTLKSFATLANDLRVLQTQLAAALPQIQQIQTGISGIGNTAQESGTKVKGFGERLTNYLQYRVIADTVMNLQDAFWGAITVIKEYDQSLKDLQAITGATNAEVSIMGDKIIDVAKNTKFSVGEVAKGMTILGQAGLTASESVNTIQSVADLATGTLSDMATSVDVVSTAMNVFNISANRSAYVADVFANAINKSKLDLEKLKTALNYVGPAAQDAGISFEETSAAMMSLSNAGQRASTIGTGLRRLFSDLVDPPVKLAAAVQKAGMSMEDLNPKTNSLKTVLSNLDLVVTDAGAAFDIFGRYGANAVISLKGADSTFSSMLDTVGKSGSAAQMAAVQVEGLSVIYKNLQDRVEILGISFGKAGIETMLRGIGKASTAAVEAMDIFVNSTIGGFITSSALWVVSGTAMIVVLGKIITGLQAVTAAYGMNLAASASMISSGVLMSERAIKIAAGLEGVAAAAKAASASFQAFIFTGGVLGTTIGAFLVPLTLAIGYFAYAVKSIDEFRESSEKAVKEAANFESLQGGMSAYSEKVKGLSEDSNVLKDANIGLRAELLKAAEANNEISTSATVAALSIDAYTGKINDNGAALKIYNAELEKNKVSKLVQSYSDAISDIDNQTGGLNRTLNYMSSSFQGWGLNLKASMDSLLDWDWNKLEKGARKAGKFAEEMDKSFDFSKALQNNEKTFDEFAAYVAELNSIGFDKLSDTGKDLVKLFNNIDERSGAIISHLMKTNQISLNDTVGQVESVADSLGLAKVDIDSVIAGFLKLKEAKLKADSQPLTTFDTKFGKDSTGKAGDGGLLSNMDEMRRTSLELNVKFTDIEEKDIENRVKANQELVANYKETRDKLSSILNDTDASKADKNAATNELVKLDREHQEAVRKINRENEQDAVYNAARKLEIARETYIKDLDEASKHQEGSVELYRANAEAFEKYERAKKDALIATYDIKTLKEQLQTNTKLIQDQSEKAILQVSLEEAAKTKTKEQADSERFQLTLDRFNKEYQAAVDHQAKINALAQKDPKDVTDADQEVMKRQAVMTAFAEKELLKNVEARKKAEEEVASYTKKIGDETEKHKTEVAKDKSKYDRDILTAEHELADKILQINKTLSDKIRELSKKKLENEQKVSQDIATLNQNAVDKIRGIQQRGMSESEKQQSDFDAYTSKLAEGIKLVDAAKYSGDKAMLERGKSTIQSAQEIGASLKNEADATEAITKTTEQLVKIRQQEGDLVGRELNRDANIAINDANFKKRLAEEDAAFKIAKIKEVDVEHTVAEDKRHSLAVRDLDIEIGKWREKLKIAQDLIDIANKASGNILKTGTNTAQTPSTSNTTSTNQVDNTVNNVAKATDAVKSLNSETEKAVSNSLNGMEKTANAVGENADKVVKEVNGNLKGFDDSYKTTEVNGVKVFSNIKDAAFKYNDEIAKSIKTVGPDINGIFAVGNVDTSGMDVAKGKIDGIIKLSNDGATLKISAIDKDGSPVEKIFDGVQKGSTDLNESLKTNPVNIVTDVKASDGKSLSETVADVKTEATSISEVKPEVSIKVTKEEFDDLYQKLQSIKDGTTIIIKVQLENSEELAKLVEVITALNSTDSRPKVTVEVTGTDELAGIKALIESIQSKAVDVIVNVRDSITDLKNVLTEIENVMKHDGDVANVTTKITTVKSDSSAGGSTGTTTAKGYATGGSVFQRLKDRFITSGSGQKDDVPAMLKKNEFVHTDKAVGYYGVPFMRALNSLKIPKNMLPGFNYGGLVGSLDGFVQKFSSGGSVLGSGIGKMRKRLEDMIGVSGSNTASNMNISLNNTILQGSGSLKTTMGMENAASLRNAFSESISKFASGGLTTGGMSVNSLKNEMNNKYLQAIALAKSNGDDKAALILKKEKDDINALADKLSKDLSKLKKDYDEYVRKTTEDHNVKVSDIETAYKTNDSELETKHSEDITELKASFADKVDKLASDESTTDSSYAEAIVKFKTDKENLKKSYEEASRVANSQYVAAREEVNKLGAEISTVLGRKQVDDDIKARTLRDNNLSRGNGPGFSNPFTEGRAHAGSFTDKEIAIQMKKAYGPYSVKGSDTPDFELMRKMLLEIWPELNTAATGVLGNEDLNTPRGEGATVYIPQSMSVSGNLTPYQKILKKAGYDPGPDGSKLMSSGKGSGQTSTTTAKALTLGNYGQEKFSSIIALEKQINDLKPSVRRIAYEKSIADVVKEEVLKADEYKKKKNEISLSRISDQNEYNKSLKEKNDEYNKSKSKYRTDHSTGLDSENKSFKSAIAKAAEDYKNNVQSSKDGASTSYNSIRNSAASAYAEEKKKMLETAKSTDVAMKDSMSKIGDNVQGIIGKGMMSIEEFFKKLGYPIRAYNSGGHVSPTSTSIPGKDSILASLTPNEYVIPDRVVSFFGKGFFDDILNFKVKGFNLGGSVSSMPESSFTNISSLVQHSLDLTVNGSNHGSLYGEQTTIESILNDLNLGRMRS